MKHTPAVCRSDMLPVRTFDFWRGECLYSGNAYIMLGRWIDANDHI